MSDPSKVPPPPWASPGQRTRPTSTGAQGTGPSGGRGADAWPDLDDLANRGAGQPGAPQTGPGAAPWDNRLSEREAPEREEIPLDQPSPDGPRYQYNSDDDAPPERPERTGPGTHSPPPPGRRGGKPIGSAHGAASSIIRSEAKPMWRIVLVRFVLPVFAVLVFLTLYDHWTIKSAFATKVSHDTIMGFDANIPLQIEEMAAEQGYKLGPDGVQGWILGAERRWIIRVHVRKHALLVVPYYSHFVFEGDLPYNLHVETHLHHFVGDPHWSFDESIIQTYQTLTPTRPGLDDEVKDLRARSLPPPK